ncbi:MAG: omptin family outer membrane protease, partial [Candidatus Heimdallarchaeota archaeon]|nr:omptin family outer membrane protease [Candidatus Heimdallarchaeota archaeon]
SIHAVKKFHKSDNKKTSMNFELSTDFGVLNGMIKELLYYDINSDQTFSYRVSQLDWEITPIYYAGITMSINPVWNLHISSGIWKLLGNKLGKMEDRDWVDENGAVVNGELMQYSEHDNFLDNGILFDVNISYSFSLNESLTISPVAGFSYRQIKMKANNGYGLYPFNSGVTSFTYSGTVITYEQKQKIPYIGVNLSYKANEKLTCSLSGFFTIFASIDANDMHLSNNQDFRDEISNASYLSLIASFNYIINRDTFLSLSANYIYIPKSMGYALKRPIGFATYMNYLSNQGGTSWSLWGINLSLGIKISIN